MKRTLEHFLIISGFLLVCSCKAQNPTTNPNSTSNLQTNQPADSVPIQKTSLIDSIRSTIGVEDLNDCIDYLESYYETNSKEDLDSAVARFDKFSKQNEAADPYLRMGATCEILGEHVLAEKYYRKGKSINLAWMKKPESASHMEKMFQLYDYYFAMLLNETVDIQKVTSLENELSHEMPIFSMSIPEGHSREELLDAFSY